MFYLCRLNRDKSQRNFEHPQVQQALYEAYGNEIPSYLEAGKMGTGSRDMAVTIVTCLTFHPGMGA